MDWDANPPFGFRSASDLNSAFQGHCDKSLNEVHLAAVLSKQRVLDVFQAWKEDLERGEKRNFREEGISPGHVKAAAFLTYWLRREAPIADLKSVEGQYSQFAQLCIECDLADESGMEPVSDEELTSVVLEQGFSLAELLDHRKRAYAYGNELFAFTFGWTLAKQYEEQSLKERGINESVSMPPFDFVEDICYLFKFKNVSPHAIDLIFRALLMVRSENQY